MEHDYFPLLKLKMFFFQECAAEVACLSPVKIIFQNFSFFYRYCRRYGCALYFVRTLYFVRPLYKGHREGFIHPKSTLVGSIVVDNDRKICMMLLNVVGMENLERPFCPTVLGILGVLGALYQLNYILACAPILFLQ